MRKQMRKKTPKQHHQMAGRTVIDVLRYRTRQDEWNLSEAKIEVSKWEKMLENTAREYRMALYADTTQLKEIFKKYDSVRPSESLPSNVQDITLLILTWGKRGGNIYGEESRERERAVLPFFRWFLPYHQQHCVILRTRKLEERENELLADYQIECKLPCFEEDLRNMRAKDIFQK